MKFITFLRIKLMLQQYFAIIELIILGVETTLSLSHNKHLIKDIWLDSKQHQTCNENDDIMASYSNSSRVLPTP